MNRRRVISFGDGDGDAGGVSAPAPPRAHAPARAHPPPRAHAPPLLALLLAGLLAATAAAAIHAPLAAADAAPSPADHDGFSTLTPFQPTPGFSVELRLPLGGAFRPGCRWPLTVRIKSSQDLRVRVGVVPELWQVDQETAALGDKTAPRVDLARAAGGSWTEPIAVGGVSGAAAAGLVAPLAPLLDDARRHLVVVVLDAGSDLRGAVFWRADIGPRLHALQPGERLVVRIWPDRDAARAARAARAGAPA
ncbi:MAG: hypothetical protein ACREJ2_16190, partial [Planctomycetota bacterium]